MRDDCERVAEVLVRHFWSIAIHFFIVPLDAICHIRVYLHLSDG